MFRHPLTEDTDLRMLEPRHAEELYARIDANREHLGRWLSWVPRTQSVDSTHLRECLHRFAEDGSPYCGIWQDGRLVGGIDMLGINLRARSTEIGYWLEESAQGRGLVTRACRALVNHAFHTLNVNRVEIRAEPANRRSRAVAERLGFSQEGTLRQVVNMGDRLADRTVYALLREDWTGEPECLTFAHPLTSDAELRLLQPHDAEELFALVDDNRAHIRPWMTWTDATTSADVTRSFIRGALHAQAEGTEYHWGIWYQGRIAGVIGTLPVNHAHRKVEIGYWLGEAFQGKGLITAAARAMLRFIFNTLDLRRVEIRCDTRNARSRAVADRLGFTHEGTTRQSFLVYDAMVDMHHFGLLREEWEQSCT